VLTTAAAIGASGCGATRATSTAIQNSISPKMTSATATFISREHGKDKDSGLTVQLLRGNGELAAEVRGTGFKFDDQPIEGHYRLTRRSLELLLKFENPVGVVTKGPMIVRDKDVLSDLAAGPGCSVYVSVPTVDEEAWQRLEPGTAPPLQRLRAVRDLADAGIRAGVLMNPIVPGITSKPALLERTIKAIADHGARFVGCNVMFLEGGTRDHFMRWTAREFPHLVDRYNQLYAGKYAPAAYRKEVQNVVGLLRKKLRREPTKPTGRAIQSRTRRNTTLTG
jgi:hypothetical protein